MGSKMEIKINAASYSDVGGISNVGDAESEDFLVGPGCPPRTTTPPGTVGRGSVGDAGSGDTSLVGDGAGDSTSSTIEINGLKIDPSALARVLRGKLREVVDKAFDG